MNQIVEHARAESRCRALAAAAMLAVVAASACSAPGGPSAFPAEPPGLGALPDPVPDQPAVVQASCATARSHEPLKAHTQVMAEQGSMPGGKTMFTSALFQRFRALCGACHVDGAQGNFNVTAATFKSKVDEASLARIRSDDPARYMPTPAAGGKPFAQRDELDPVRELAKLLELWMRQGRPGDVFTLADAGEVTQENYRLTPDVGETLTNIGNCVPAASIVARAAPAMDVLDARFAQATQLPDTLAETDLTTFDSEALASQGVIAFAPAYPLFSDNAGKIRHVRVPRGQSIQFDPATQKFVIPPNTRFYKTFLKQVKEVSGRDSYRKMETRVIVSRPDTVNADGTAKTNALFGTYVWDESTGQALLLRDRLNDGTGFADRLISYVQDEAKEKQVRDSQPPNLSYALEWEHPEVMRHYAVPGSQRCIECHMGADAQSSFILGFTPMQIHRRPEGEGGVFEAAGPDELTQLQRLIDYGVISGLASAADIVPLEASQGERKPRNQHELKAQAYMLGNCSFCHNPRGFPSVKNSELKQVLDFMPSEKGGIFQFPLDRYSPLRLRGLQRDVPMPYITPSLREYPAGVGGSANWSPKWIDCSVPGAADDFSLCASSQGILHLSAPWRSLIYRNVDTPFTYADDYVIFPKMPMHGSGYDCRAAKIMGDWMVSIPARLKDPKWRENVIAPLQDGDDVFYPIKEPQPYVEVLPGQPEYPLAQAGTKKRLGEWRSSFRYAFCPDDRDIVDRKVLRQGPSDPLMPPDESVYNPEDLSKTLMPRDGVPDRPHWVVTDLTEAPGEWGPRRNDWKDVILQQCTAPPAPTELPLCQIKDRTGLNDEQVQEQEKLIGILQKVRIDPALRTYALTEVPVGLWQSKPGCSFADVPKAKDFTVDQRPHWMRKAKPTDLPADAPVFMQAPGQTVFEMICRNCHGPQADSRGLMADVILSMTGGTARVANFRDGLFGPVHAPGANRDRVFLPTSLAGVNATGEDLGALYMVWMALGGTQRRLPEPVLNIISTTPVLGVQRNGAFLSTRSGSANMLRLAQELCAHVLPISPNIHNAKLNDVFFETGLFDYGEYTSLIGKMGEAEMWMNLCSIGNEPVVRVVKAHVQPDKKIELVIDRESSFFWSSSYPATAPVLDHRGRLVNGVKPGNHFPLCVSKPSNAPELSALEAYLASHLVKGIRLPWCPDGFESAQNRLKFERDDQGTTVFTDAETWATRGAVNAGAAVFLYLDQLVRGKVVAKGDYNQCK